MDLFPSFTKHWNQAFPQFQKENSLLLLAVSGGLDSVIMAHLLAEMGFHCCLLHVNFQLRGAESDRDELFVRALAQSMQMEISVEKFDTLAFSQLNGIGIQEAARKLRYQWFEDKRLEFQLRFEDKRVLILTAHHANDNLETVLMNFFRGTGVQGLKGIAAFQKNSSLLRPLLPFKREDLVAYATERKIEYVEDSSNASNKYTRNFLRNGLLPQLQEYFPQVTDNLIRNIERMKDVSEIYQAAIQKTLSSLMEWKGTECQITILKLQKTSQLNTVIWELISPFGFSVQQIPELIKLMDAANGSSLHSPSHQIIRNRKWLLIAPKQSKAPMFLTIDSVDTEIRFPAGLLSCKSKGASFIFDDNPNKANLDLKHISFPLLLRKPKSGDYFYPFGMEKKKKLNRFFIDQKLSKTQKESIWVLESNNRIIWVLGLRIDNRFKCKSSTETVVEFCFTPDPSYPR